MHYDQHTSEDDDQEKIIGRYSTEERARAAMERLRDKPGFRDYPERWYIGASVLDRDSAWTTGFFTALPGDTPWEEEDSK